MCFFWHINLGRRVQRLAYVWRGGVLPTCGDGGGAFAKRRSHSRAVLRRQRGGSAELCRVEPKCTIFVCDIQEGRETGDRDGRRACHDIYRKHISTDGCGWSPILSVVEQPQT